MKKSTEDFLKDKLNFTIETLMNISYDEKHHEYLTDSKITAVDFDNLKRTYCENRGIEKHLSSNDALYFSDEQWFFIEFKNGHIVDEGKSEYTTIRSLEDKINQSLLILFSPEYLALREYFPEYVNDISFSLEKISYILVYNDKKNRKPTKADKESWRKQVRKNEYDPEIQYLKENYKKILLTKEVKKFEATTCENFIEKKILEEKFITLIQDIRKEMNQNNLGAFDDLLDILSQEAMLPLMRFGLEEYENKLFNKVYTYTGDTFDTMGNVETRGQFYHCFVEKYSRDEL